MMKELANSFKDHWFLRCGLFLNPWVGKFW